MGEVWIGVTGFHATDNPEPGLAVVRALRRADPSWRIMALVRDGFGTGALAAGLVDAHALLPFPSAGGPALLARLGAIVRTQPLDLLVPTTDAEQAQTVALRGPLHRLGIRTWLPSAPALRARDKRHLPALGRRAGVAVPETRVLASPAAVARVASERRYPQILKGPLVDSAVVHSPEHFRVAARELGETWGYPLLAQPLIPGEEYDVAVVARRGEVVGLATMKKLGVTGKGTAWAGVTVEAPRLEAAARRLVRALRWDGALEAEFLATPDGRLVCFEINPRFPSWIAVAAEAGANLPALLVRRALGDEIEPVTARPGRLFTRTVHECVFPERPRASLPPDRGVRTPAVPAGAPPVRLAPGLTPTTELRAHRAGSRSARPAGAAEAGGVVAITGLNAADNPSPGLTVARALRDAPIPPRLVGLTPEVLATGVYVDGLWDEVRLLPFPSGEGGDYADALVWSCRAAGADCLLPTLDIEIPVVTRLADRLAAAGVATLLPSPAALAAVAKSRLPALAARGFRLPRTESVAHPDDLGRVARRLGTPFVLKGPVADAQVVRTEEEARVAAARLASTWRFPLLAQEFIPGEELGIAAVADRRHRVVGAVVVRKEIRTRNGNTWGGTVVGDAALRGLADRFAAALRWVGPFELEVIRHPRRGAVLIEVNPRFPGWVFLSAGAGANLPWAAVCLARGERVPPLAPRPGTFYARMAWDVTAPVERMGALAVEGRVAGHVA